MLSLSFMLIITSAVLSVPNALFGAAGITYVRAVGQDVSYRKCVLLSTCLEGYEALGHLWGW